MTGKRRLPGIWRKLLKKGERRKLGRKGCFLCLAFTREKWSVEVHFLSPYKEGNGILSTNMRELVHTNVGIKEKETLVSLKEWKFSLSIVHKT